MTLHLGKRIVSTYVLPVATYTILVLRYLATCRKHKLQSLLDQGICWATKVYYLTRNQTVRAAMGVRSMNATIKSI